MKWSGTYTWFPAYLVFTLAETALVLAIYPILLNWQGRLLQDREQRILEIVSARVE